MSGLDLLTCKVISNGTYHILRRRCPHSSRLRPGKRRIANMRPSAVRLSERVG